MLTSIEILKLKKKENVYNITLDKDNVYYANGVLVSNCGDMFMMRMWFELKEKLNFSFITTRPEYVKTDKAIEQETEYQKERKKQLKQVDFGPKRDWVD